MDWKSVKIILASTATVAVATQLVKKVYTYFKTPEDSNEPCPIKDCRHHTVKTKDHEINDVILFSDDVVRQSLRLPPNSDVTTCESRELNCFKLIRYIKSAQETLDVCMYLITSSEIAEHIIKLGQKHVLVRILVDSEMAYTSPSQIRKLKEYSFIKVQTNSKSILMHHKFCIIDGPRAIKRKNILKAYAEKLNIHHQGPQSSKTITPQPTKGFVMSGSLNWSTQAMVTNYESVIVTSNSNIVNKFEKEFESLWVENEPAFKNC